MPLSMLVTLLLSALFVFLGKETYAKIKELLEGVPTYSITCADTPVDKWCENFWKPTLHNCKCGAKNSSNVTDFVIVGDYVMEVFYPLSIRQEMDETFAKAKKVEDVNWPEFYSNVFEKKIKIPVIILKNKVLADDLKRQTMLAFK